MRYAKLTPSETGASPWIIADDELGRGAGSRFLVEGLPGFTQKVQSGDYTGATFTEALNRRNRNGSIALLVEHEFENADECFQFAVTLLEEVPEEGVLEIGVSGGFRKLFNCVVNSVTPRLGTQVSLTLEYQLQISPVTE